MMILMRKKLLLILFATSVFGCAAQSKVSASKDVENSEVEKIKETVRVYCIKSTKMQFEEIAEIITITPSYYWQRPYNHSNEPVTTENTQNDTAKTNPSDNFSDIYYQHVSRSVPLAFRWLKLPIEEPKNVWVNNDYARLRLTVKFKNEKILPSDKDFFLVKMDGNWKIFKVSTPDYSEKFPF